VGDPISTSEILFSSDPATRRALWTIFGLVVPIAVAVFLPLIVRTTRLWLLERRLHDTLDEYQPKGPVAQRGALREWLRGSAIQRQFEEFERRWTTAQLTEGGGRAPIRLLDVLEDQPLLPMGPRRSLIPVLPGLFLGIGVFGALFGLIPSVAGMAVPPADGTSADPLALALGLALRATAWGFAAAIAASLVGRLVEGSFDARGRGLDDVLVRAYESVSPGELAEITRQTQQRSLETLGRELTQFAHELNERLERGLQRIEQSSARAASLVSQEQRGALHSVVQELSLSVRQGVDHHLAELRGALQRAVDYQSSVTNGLSETFERMVENAQMQDRVARTLGESANALDAAAQSLRSGQGEALPRAGAAETRPIGEGFGAESLGPSDVIAAQLAEEIGDALRGFTEQVHQIDRTMEALRLEIHEESRARRDAVADPARRAKSDRPLAPRERSWAPAPADRPSDRAAERAGERPADRPSDRAGDRPIERPAAERAGGAAPVLAPAAAAAAATPAASAAPIAAAAPIGSGPVVAPSPTTSSAPAASSSSPPAATLATGAPLATGAAGAPGAERSAGADLASTDGPIGRELSLSGFRVGAPRAQGPDPYERLASGFEPPSNVRHFPTRERELGDELKLSGLLGPSSPPGGGAPQPAPRREPLPSAEERSDPERAARSDERD